MHKSSAKLDPQVVRSTAQLAELEQRMQRPQRHRLLHGYPMAPLMRPIGDYVPTAAPSDLDLIVGVLPHPFCNPTVEGCGFCTFPHQKYHRSTSARVVHAVRRELAARAVGNSLRDRRVPAVYVGGGTANLVAPDLMAELYRDLTTTLSLEHAELTLEGAPRYFLTRGEAHLDLLAEQTVEHRRISMGVQTFDERWLTKMGRMSMGAPDHVEQAAEGARRRGITTSCDLLYNLPGQSRAAMLADVERAAALGFDQICVYHLVLFHGLGTKWSEDAGLVRAMPSSSAAATNWLAVRARLLELGYRQSTLTNFERADLPDAKRFRYERLSFQPRSTDGMGLGPGGLTTFASRFGQWKTMNHVDASAYVDAVDRGVDPTDRAFRYALPDQYLLRLTRQIPLLAIQRGSFEDDFGFDPMARWKPEIEAMTQMGLLDVHPGELRLTPLGMFYADSVAGLLASSRVRELREHRDVEGWNEAEMHHMG